MILREPSKDRRTMEYVSLLPCSHYLIHTKVLGGQIIFQEKTYGNKHHPVSSLSHIQTLCKTLIKWWFDVKPQGPRRKVEIRYMQQVMHLKPRRFQEENALHFRPFPLSSYHSMHFIFLQKQRRYYRTKNAFFFGSPLNVHSVWFTDWNNQQYGNSIYQLIQVLCIYTV